MSAQLQVTGEAKIRDIQGPVVANSGVITALDGAASQYVRGDGTLADFPTSSGGGSSVSYYLNSSVSQGTIGGVAYRELNKEPIIGAGTDIAISTTGYVASYLTDANDPDVLSIPGGNFNCEFYFSVSNDTGNPFFYAELYKYDGTTFTLLGSSVGVPEYINQGTIIAPYYFAIPVPTSALALTDRLAIRIYVNVDGRTVTLHTENGHLCQVVTTLSKGMVSLNNLTDQSQFLTTGTSGTDFTIASTGDTHTFNLPIASATNTGKLSSTDWTTFNNKQNALTNPVTGTGTSGQVAYFNGTSSITSNAAFAFTPTSQLLVNNSVTAASAIARGTNLTPTLTAAANNDVLVGLDINPSFNTGAFTNVGFYALRVNGVVSLYDSAGATQIRIIGPSGSNKSLFFGNSSAFSAFQNVRLYNQATTNLFVIATGDGTANPTDRFFITQGGNVGINTSGTDAGYTLDINGTARVQGNTQITGSLSIGSTTTGLNPFLQINSSSRADIVLRTGGTNDNAFSIYAVGGAFGSNYAEFGTNNGINAGSQGGAIYTDSRTGVAPPIRFAVKGTGTTAMTIAGGIQSNGNWGIGTTTDAGFRLDVNGTARVVGNLTTSLTTFGSVAQAFTFGGEAVYGTVGSLGTIFLQGGLVKVGNQNNVVVSGTALGTAANALLIQGTHTSSSAGIQTDLGINTTLNFASSGYTYRGIWYNPTITSLGGNRHIAVETATGDVLLGTTSGNVAIGTSTLGTATELTLGGSQTASSAIARGGLINTTLVAAANNDVLVGLDINPTFTNGAFTGVSNIGLRITATTQLSLVGSGGTQNISQGLFSNDGNTNINQLFLGDLYFAGGRFRTGFLTNSNRLVLSTNNIAGRTAALLFGLDGTQGDKGLVYDRDNAYISLVNGTNSNSATYTPRLTIFQNGNTAINTTTDAGFRLDVNGTARVQDLVHLSNASGGQIRMWTSTANNSGIYGINSSSTGIYGNAHVQFDLFVRSTGSGTKKFGQSSLGNTNNICITNNNTSLEPIMITTTDSGAVGIMKSTSTIPASAVFEIESTTKGFLPPRGTNAQRNAISSPAVGLIFYCTDATEGLYIYTSSGWKSLTMT